MRSAGLSPRKIKTNGKIWSATNEFFEKCPTKNIIGVTGTKGKGTTCSLITSILRAAGHTVHLVGNIGTPSLDILPKIQSNDIVVYELSSFQLWDLKKSPHIAVILMIEPDHLDVHADMDDYVAAKANIRKYQTLSDVCLYHPTNTLSERIAGTSLVNVDTNEYGGSISFASRYAIKDDDQVYVEEGYFCVQDRRVCSIDNLQLPGTHNLENACAAMSAVTELWLDVKDEHYAKGLRDFTGLPHRLKFVDEINGVKFYDDSIATTPGSAIAAVQAFAQPKVLILGGSNKGAEFSELVLAAHENNVTHAVLIGAEATRLEKAFEGTNINIVNLGESMAMSGIVQTAYRLAQPGDVVILSPACASFGMFKNYSDRGDQFVRAVEQIKADDAAAA